MLIKDMGILDAKADAIVLDGSDLLKPAAGVSEKLFERASCLLKDQCDRLGFTDAARACCTRSFGGAEAEYVIHVLSPEKGCEGDRELLARTYKEAIGVAVYNGWKKLAVMLLGVERGGWDEDEAAEIAEKALAELPEGMEITLYK